MIKRKKFVFICIIVKLYEIKEKEKILVVSEKNDFLKRSKSCFFSSKNRI